MSDPMTDDDLDPRPAIVWLRSGKGRVHAFDSDRIPRSRCGGLVTLGHQSSAITGAPVCEACVVATRQRPT